MKTEKKYLILAVLIISILAVVFIFGRARVRNMASPERQADLNIREAQAQSYTASKTPTLNDTDHIFGSRSASLKVFVYEDYASIYSAQLADTLEKIYQENSQAVAVIVRPYISKNSPLSETTALSVSCAGEQGKWKEMRALIFAQIKSNQLSAEKFNPDLSQLNLDENKFDLCLTNLEKQTRIDKVIVAAKDYSVIGAPTLFINDEMIPGARPYDDYVDSDGDKVEGLNSLIVRKLK